MVAVVRRVDFYLLETGGGGWGRHQELLFGSGGAAAEVATCWREGDGAMARWGRGNGAVARLG